MLSTIARRLLFAIPTIIVIIALAFLMMRATPGGPFSSERQLPPEIERRLNERFDLDKPPLVQLWLYLGRLSPISVGVSPEEARDCDTRAGVPALCKTLNFIEFQTPDFGPSMKYKDKTVIQIIAEGLPTSLIVGLSSILLAIGIGVGLGAMAALQQNKPQDYIVMTLAVAGVCVPPLVMGPVLSWLFGVSLPGLGIPSAGLYRDAYAFNYLILPVVTLAMPQIAIISRLTRAAMIEALRSNAIRTARAKGLPEHLVVWRHALPVAVLPVVSYLGPAIAGVLTGSFVIETVFQLPGIGRAFVMGAATRDYTLVMGVVILYATLIILLNLLADILYGWLDPRARQS